MTHELFDTNHLAKTYFKMAVPVVWGLVVTLLYNLADTFFIGSTGNTSLVAGVMQSCFHDHYGIWQYIWAGRKLCNFPYSWKA